MFVMHGKYNIAKVFLPEDQLDIPTKEQIQSFLNHPAFKGEPISIMPDCHYGKGSCVGFTMPLNDYIIPNIVGVDIGCGVSTYKLGKFDSSDIDMLDFNETDNKIREVIPIGFNVGYYDDNVDYANNLLPSNYGNVVEKINPSKSIYFIQSLGTLGGGNHFIEIGLGDSGNYYLTVHTGSRNFGLSVANYYQNVAKELRHRFFDSYDYKDAEFLPRSFGGDFDGNNYLFDMRIAQEYAKLNRQIIVKRILSHVFNRDFNSNLYIESIHNYIGDDNIIRKGAISAREGEGVIIPFNMEDGLILGYGKGNPDWNYSAPHGAGRILSRNKAKSQLNLSDAISGMNNAGVFTTSLNSDTLDEAKGAYKDKDMIIEMIKDTIEITEFVKPIYNLKAGGE